MDTIAPVLQSLGITIAPYDATEGRAGDLFVRTSPEFRTGKSIIEFGSLPLGQGGTAAPIPHNNFMVVSGSPILAVADGVVRSVMAQGDDYEIMIGRTLTGSWIVSYDHVTRPRVTPGSTVKAGDTIAFAGEQRTPTAAWMWELMLANLQTGVAHCPARFLHPSQAPALAAAFSRFMQEWEALSGDPSEYDEAAMVAPACLTISVPIN